MSPTQPPESATSERFEEPPPGMLLHRPCPACGAPLTMDVLSRTLTCPFCRRSHFLTGERTHVTAFLEPRVPAADARLSARKGLRERLVRATLVSEPRLLFVPYWRITTRLFSWHMTSHFTRVTGSEAEEAVRSITACKDIDITFPAVMLSTGLHGLSTRPAVLEAHAFDPARLPAGAEWIEPEWDARESLSIGLARALELEAQVLRGALQAKRIVPHHLGLTLLYFPFFVVQHRFRDEPAGRIFVDAVGGEITAWERPILEQLPQAGAARPPEELAGFLPLVCPECTFTLAGEPLDEVFRCPNCARAWQAEPFGLAPVSEAAPGVDAGFEGVRLPLWRFRGTLELPGLNPVGSADALRTVLLAGEAPSQPGPAGISPAAGLASTAGRNPGDPVALGPGESGNDGLCVYIPAFEGRQPEKVLETAVRFTLNGPQWQTAELKLGESCRTASAAAARLVDICLLRALSSAPKLQQKFLQDGKFRVLEVTLLWVPFKSLGPEVVEPLTNAAISKHALQPWSQAA